MRSPLLPLLLLGSLLGGCEDQTILIQTPDGWGGDRAPTLPVFEPPDDGMDDVCEDASTESLTLHMSADDSNSQALPALARRAIATGDTVSGTMRPYEFLNHYSFDYEPAAAGQVALVPQVRRDEEGLTMVIAAVAPDVDPAERAAMNLTFSIDTSCSMGGEPLRRVEEALVALSGELREGDVVSAATWSSENTTLLDSHAISGSGDAVLTGLGSQLTAGGGTDLEQGLAAAYALASANFDGDKLNRVVFFSDGGANIGVTSRDLIARHSDDGEEEGIYLVAVGATDDGFYEDALMNEVSDLGKGSYVFLDRDGEAERLFTGPNMLATMAVAARDVRLAVTLPAGFVLDTFHGEEVSEDPDEVEPQHLAPNDQMLYHYTLADCTDGTGDPVFGFELTWSDPVTREDATVTVERRLSELLDSPRRQLEKADAIVAYADALSTLLTEDLDLAEAKVTAALAAFPGDADLQEIQSLLLQVR
jgi:Ca-activated chloride channel homolog